jgi:hypothetical protein
VLPRIKPGNPGGYRNAKRCAAEMGFWWSLESGEWRGHLSIWPTILAVDGIDEARLEIFTVAAKLEELVGTVLGHYLVGVCCPTHGGLLKRHGSAYGV